MELKLPILRADPAASVRTARFGLLAAGSSAPSMRAGPGGTLRSATETGLPSGTDGLPLPIVVAVGAGLLLIAGLVLVALVRRRVTAAQSSDAAESDALPQSSLGSVAGRNRNLPRWLDPSIAAARFRTDTTTATRTTAPALPTAPTREPIVFGESNADPGERLQVRFDGVPLLDRPDDVLGQTECELEGGDEVEVLDRSEIWARVRTPSGVVGWVPSMTMSAIAPTTAEDAAETPDPIEPEPQSEADEPPALEALLEAIAAQRLARQEQASHVDLEPAAAIAPTPAPTVAPNRTRTRKLKTDQPAAATAAPKRPRTRKPTTDQPAVKRR